MPAMSDPRVHAALVFVLAILASALAVVAWFDAQPSVPAAVAPREAPRPVHDPGARIAAEVPAGNGERAVRREAPATTPPAADPRAAEPQVGAARVIGRLVGSAGEAQPGGWVDLHALAVDAGTRPSVQRVLVARDGSFALTELPAGRYVLVAGAPLHRTARHGPFRIDERSVLELGAMTLDEGHALHVSVQDAAGSPVVGARLELLPVAAEAAGTRRARSDAEGTCQFDGLAPGLRRLRVQAEGFAARELDGIDPSLGRVAITLERDAR